MARASYEYARDYAKQRVQFGEPIAHRQSIAFMLADMATEVDEARLMVWETAWKLDQGEDAMKEATVMKHHVDRMVLDGGRSRGAGPGRLWLYSRISRWNCGCEMHVVLRLSMGLAIVSVAFHKTAGAISNDDKF